jgi:hypothetical protein
VVSLELPVAAVSRITSRLAAQLPVWYYLLYLLYLLTATGRGKVRKTLNTLYESLSSGMAGKNEDSATAAFYPYVDIEIRYTGDADI